MDLVAIFWFGLVILILIGAGVANRLPIPPAVIWAVLGVVASFTPGIPQTRLDPHIALLLVLPPLVYSSAVQLPWADFQENLGSISLLAVGLVLATTAAVALLAHRIAGLPWAAAVTLGAVISPTDPVAASAVAARIGLPQRIVAILEGEGLVNDAVSLSIFHISLAAWAGSTFSVEQGVLRFVAILVGEPLYGYLLALLIAYIRGRITDPVIEIGVSLLTPFAAYLVPEQLGGSGILATLAVGMYIGEQSSTLIPAGTRLHATSFWRMIVFLLNGGLFITAGLELGRVVQNASAANELVRAGLLIGGGVAAIRIAWCFVALFGSRAMRRLLGRSRQRGPGGTAQLAVIAWAGMRGPISLAAALSIPVAAEPGGSGEFRVVLAITAIVIVLTLVGQGATLAAIANRLGLRDAARGDQERLRDQRSLGEREAAAAALRRLDELQSARRLSSQDAARLRRLYQDRLEQVAAGLDREEASSRSDIRSELIAAERARILALRKEGRIDDHALQVIQRTLDLRDALIE